MKKITSISLAVLITLLFFSSCEKKISAPKAGEAKAEDMLNLIPKDANAVFFVDINKAMSAEIVKKTITEDKNYEKYQEFIEKTGIDPQKDIYFAAIGITKGIADEQAEGVAIINLKYDKDILLSKIKDEMEKEEESLQEEEYNKIKIYNAKDKKGEGSFAFLDSSNIVIGNSDKVKSVLNILNKKEENIFNNETLSSLIKRTKKDAIFWGALDIPSEAINEATSKNPMLNSLSAIHAVCLYFDYQNKNIISEIKAISADKTKNQQIADQLTGLKAFGSSIATEKPEIGELINNIEITTGDDYVKIYSIIPEELISKIKGKMESSPDKN